jgi:hypothetical protein
MDERMRIAEINVKVGGTTPNDAKRIMRQAEKALQSVEGLTVTSMWLVRETNVPLIDEELDSAKTKRRLDTLTRVRLLG